MFNFKVTLSLFIILAVSCTKQVIAMNETNKATSNPPAHAKKMMLLEEHMKNMGAEQSDVKHKITKDLHHLHEQGKCPNLTPDDINKTLRNGGYDEYNHINGGKTLTLEKDNRKYILKFTVAQDLLEATSKVVLTKKSSELTPGEYNCKYKVRTESGGLLGALELALEK